MQPVTRTRPPSRKSSLLSKLVALIEQSGIRNPAEMPHMNSVVHFSVEGIGEN
jgi:hypothetical protein